MSKPMQAVPGSREPLADRPALGIAMLLLLLAAFIRCPSILIHGRMWAEELPVFLRFSQRHTFLYVLPVQHFGYYSIWDNFLGAVAAHWVPLTCVALLFSWSAVVILLLTGYFVFEAEFLPTREAKLLGVLALVLTAPSLETWLNVLNSEFYFGLCSAVILLSDASRLRLPRYAALLLAVLCGPVTTLLAPLFFLRAVVGRTRPQIVQATIVCLGGLTQIGIAIASAMANRSVHPDPMFYGAIIFSKDFLQLFLTRKIAEHNFNMLSTHAPISHLVLVGYWVLTLTAIAGLLVLVRRRSPSLWLLCVAFWLIFLQFTLGREAGPRMISPIFNERYAFAPNILLVLAIIAVAAGTIPSTRRSVARGLLVLAFLSGFYDFVFFSVRTPPFWKGEPWRQQVLRQQHDPTVTLSGFPIGWSLPGDEMPPP